MGSVVMIFIQINSWYQEQNYAEQIMEVLSACDDLRNQVGPGEYAPKPARRPLTKFERRGERLGHGVWDLLFSRC